MALESSKSPENNFSKRTLESANLTNEQEQSLYDLLGVDSFEDPTLKEKVAQYQSKKSAELPEPLTVDGDFGRMTLLVALSDIALRQGKKYVARETKEAEKNLKDEVTKGANEGGSEFDNSYTYDDGTLVEWNGKNRGIFRPDGVHGEGIKITKPDRSIYEGNFDNGVMKGYGTYTQPDGVSFSGEWITTSQNGREKVELLSGVIKHKGSVYEGDIQGMAMHGKGVLKNPEGQITYDGDWENGSKNGIGKGYKDGILSYDGEWKDNKLDGQGTLYQKDGKTVKYAGTFYQNKYIRV